MDLVRVFGGTHTKTLPFPAKCILIVERDFFTLYTISTFPHNFVHTQLCKPNNRPPTIHTARDQCAGMVLYNSHSRHATAHGASAFLAS